MPSHTRSTRRALLMMGALIGGPLLAGCINPIEALNPNASTGAVDRVLGAVKLIEEGGFEMDVPIDVYLLGFDAATVDAIRAKLEPTPVDHSPFSFDRFFPPDGENAPLGGVSFRAPTQPRAIFTLTDLDAAFENAFYSAAAGWKVAESKNNAYDANLAEAYLADALGTLRGRPLDRSAPVFVVIHGGDALAEHAWRYTYSHGYLEPIRIFGEKLPVVAFDVSAISDPWVVGTGPSLSPLGLVFGTVFGPTPTKDYDYPLPATGDKTVSAVTELITDSAHYRFLKGPIYPISTKPCHHVTLLLAVHQTSIAEQLPDFKRAKDFVDVAGLEGAFRNLTGDEVTVELKTMMLPIDDPVLDALSREAAAFVTLDALRWYIDENWEKFVTPMEGCEEYFSMLLLSDPTGEPRQFGGIGTYDVKRSHRISFSIVTDLSRVRKEIDAPAPISTKNPTDAWNVVNLLYSHETGHLFGQHHPQHLSKTNDPSPANHAWESVYSVMSYETGTRVIDFGAVDYATWTMGRAGYTIAEAQHLGLEASPEFQDAVNHLSRGHWTAAHLALESHVHDASHTHATGLPDYHYVGHHWHPWG